MQRCLDATLQDGLLIDPATRKDLYGGSEFTARNWSPDQQLRWLCQLAVDHYNEIPDDFIEWHELGAMAERQLPLMMAYEAAAAMFNVLLAEAQRDGYRTNEHPTNGSALQRALSRERNRKADASD
jgi:hypothetical protein